MIPSMTAAGEVKKKKINKSVQYQFPPPLALLVHYPNTSERGSGAEIGLVQPTSRTAQSKKAQWHAVSKQN